MKRKKFKESSTIQKENTERRCKRMKRNLLIIILLTTVFIMAFTMVPSEVKAVVNCAAATAADADSDGFTDIEECSGLTLTDGTAVPNCSNGTGSAGCLNPDKKDLFVILVPAAPSLLPPNPLQYVPALGVIAHQITASQATVDRNVTSTQKAVRVTESLDTSEVTLGASNYGTPNGLDKATIFTQRIKNFVTSTCTAAGITSCKEYYTGLAVMNDIINHYMKNTISHEIGHVLQLTSVYNSRYGGYHYQTGSGVIMEQSCKYTSKGGTVTFYIPSAYASTDPASAALH